MRDLLCSLLLLVLIAVAVQGGEICEDKKGTDTCQFFKKFCKDEGDFGDTVRADCERTCGICHGPTRAPKPTTHPKPTKAPTKAPTKPPTKRPPPPPPKGCGVSPVSTRGLRIINGHDAKPGAWPWIASIQWNGFSHFCGATVLNRRWVLTAAHCTKALKEHNLHNFIVVVGAHDFFVKEPSTQHRHIKRIIVHPLWDPPKVHQGDMALLELEHPINLNKRVNVPCMPEEGVYPEIGKECVLAGWGSIVHPGNPTNLLQQTELPVVEGKNCVANPLTVCVGKGKGTGPDGKQWPNACRGDSGGPLVCQRKDGRWVFEGVASFVVTYCKYYTGYAPVNRYLSWINSYINQ